MREMCKKKVKEVRFTFSCQRFRLQVDLGCMRLVAVCWAELS